MSAWMALAFGLLVGYYGCKYLSGQVDVQEEAFKAGYERGYDRGFAHLDSEY